MYQLFITLEGGSIELIYQYLVPSGIQANNFASQSKLKLALTRLPFVMSV